VAVESLDQHLNKFSFVEPTDVEANNARLWRVVTLLLEGGANPNCRDVCTHSSIGPSIACSSD
jgi:hypothetical protein